MAEPLVSVLLAVNRDRGRLDATLDSVLSQSFHEIELIVVNDAGPPELREKLDAARDKDARVTVIHNAANLGLTRSLDRAVEQARGTYIARIDEGDVWLPGKMTMQVEFLETRPEYVLVGTQYRNYSAGDPAGRSGTRFPTEDRDIRRWLFAGLTPIIHPSIVFRRGRVAYNREARMSQDFDLFLRLSLIGRLHNLPDELLLSYTPTEAVSVTHEDLQFHNHVQIHRQFIEALQGRRSIAEYVDRGTDYSEVRPRSPLRAAYMRSVLLLMRRLRRRGLTRRILRNVLIPEFLHNYLQARSAPYRLKGTYLRYVAGEHFVDGARPSRAGSIPG
jgi:glycosyltransferase involved in cell wall biosynthesis